MADIKPGTIFRVKPGVLWKGEDIGERQGEVLNSDSYVLAAVDDVNGEVKLFRFEIENIITEEDYFADIFETELWG